MHSIKNTFVAVLLLGVSFGVYQVITTPDPTLDTKDLIGDITYSDELVLKNGLEIGNGSPELNKNSDSEAKTIELPEALELTNDKPNWVPEPEQAPNIKAPELQPPSLVGNNDPPVTNGFDQTPPTSPAFNQLASKTSSDQELIDALKHSLNEVDRFDRDPKRALIDVKPKPAVAAPPLVASTPEAESPLSDFSPAPMTDRFATQTSKAADLDSQPMANLDSVWPEVTELANAGKHRMALTKLTQHYRSNLPVQQKEKLLNWLDVLAGRVIYSTEHLFTGAPHTVSAGEHLNDLAVQWNVPAQLIYNINRDRISDPSALASGSELKVVKGPFHAEIDMSDKVLTLFIQSQYAGRFDIQSLANDLQPGSFKVTEKFSNLESLRGQRTDFNDENPFWIGLNGNFAMSSVGNKPTSIALSTKDAADVFGMLNEQSTLTIYR